VKRADAGESRPNVFPRITLDCYSSDMKSNGIIDEVWDDRFQAILDSALDAAITMDAAGYVRAWNRRAEQVFGWTKQEAIGRLLSELLIPSRFRDAQREGLRRYLETGEGPVLGRVLEMTALRKTGEEFRIELSVVAVHGKKRISSMRS